MPHVHGSSIAKIKIPIPLLRIQEEIVRILDTFTELTAELTTELTRRKIQYKYYSKQIIKNISEYNLIPLGELGMWKGGKTPSMSNKEYWENGNIP